MPSSAPQRCLCPRVELCECHEWTLVSFDAHEYLTTRKFKGGNVRKVKKCEIRTYKCAAASGCPFQLRIVKVSIPEALSRHQLIFFNHATQTISLTHGAHSHPDESNPKKEAVYAVTKALVRIPLVLGNHRQVYYDLLRRKAIPASISYETAH